MVSALCLLIQESPILEHYCQVYVTTGSASAMFHIISFSLTRAHLDTEKQKNGRYKPLGSLEQPCGRHSLIALLTDSNLF